LKDVIHTPRPAAPVTTAPVATGPGATAPGATAPVAADCLGRTCLKWSANGELTSIDLLLVLERLAQVDQQVSGLCLDSLDSQPCASIS
jgi:hypothetical protein